QQQVHSWVVASAAIAGCVAVLLAILHLTSFAMESLREPIPTAVMEVSEFVIALLALIAVGLGIGARVHTQWRLQRLRRSAIHSSKRSSCSQRHIGCPRVLSSAASISRQPSIKFTNWILAPLAPGRRASCRLPNHILAQTSSRRLLSSTR